MAAPQRVEPVKLLVAVLWADADARDAAVGELVGRYGPVDLAGPDRPFDVTDYYESEMGPRLLRRLVSFERLIRPDQLPEAKRRCNELEARLACGAGRSVNLDAGYLDHNKVVLASCKYAGQKIYLADGVYADMIARYRGGRYEPFPWTFPDFRDGRYDEELGQIRRRYLEQLRRWRRPGQADSSEIRQAPRQTLSPDDSPRT